MPPLSALDKNLREEMQAKVATAGAEQQALVTAQVKLVSEALGKARQHDPSQDTIGPDDVTLVDKAMTRRACRMPGRRGLGRWPASRRRKFVAFPCKDRALFD